MVNVLIGGEFLVIGMINWILEFYIVFDDYLNKNEVWIKEMGGLFSFIFGCFDGFFMFCD